jgi:hypothetical protein
MIDKPPPLELAPRTLAEVIVAIEGYRNQLSVFSDSALIEIELLKEWLKRITEDEDERVAEVSRKLIIQLKPIQ